MKIKYQNPEVKMLNVELEQVIATSPGSHLGNGSDEDAGAKHRAPSNDVEYGNLW